MSTGVSLLISSASADLVYPASLDVAEISPGEVEVVFTLPLIQGQVMKARPLLPEAVTIEGEPDLRTGAGSATRVWRGTVDTGQLAGSVFGVSGLQGTANDVRFVLSTLDGRRYEEVLRPTRAFVIVPQAPSAIELARASLRQGLRLAARHAGAWFLLAAMVVAGLRWRWFLLAFASVGGGLLLSRWLDPTGPGQVLPMTVSGLPGAMALVLAGVGWGSRMTNRGGGGHPPRSPEGSTWRAAVPGRRSMSRQCIVRALACLLAALLTGLLAGWGGGLAVSETGLSLEETRWAAWLLLGGWVIGGCLVAACLSVAWSLVPDRSRYFTSQVAILLAATWFLYQGAGLVQAYGPGWLVGMDRARSRLVHAWFAPFTADWAMARLRVPWLSVAVLVVGAWALVGCRSAGRRFAVVACAACLGLILLPWGTTRIPIPFAVPKALEEDQARRILEPMLSGIYHAVNLEDEGEAYDRLAEHVTGDMLTDLYVDGRRRLLAGTREGASVAVREVKVLAVGAPRDEGSEGGHLYLCRWTVTVRVTHWSHTHERRNIYEGDLILAVTDDAWKISGVDLYLEEREIVAGSVSG